MRFSLLHLFLLAATALLSSCLNTPEVEEPVEQTEILSLSEDEVVAAARAHYERYKQTTRVVGGDGEKPMWIWQAKPHAPYDLGEYEIDWSSAYTKYEKDENNQIRVHTDFDIIKENDFIYFLDPDDHSYGIKLRSRFVSVQTPDTIVQYIATYIPHESYYDRYYTVRHGGGRIGLREVNFSGRVLLTTLDGYHYGGVRAWQGDVTYEVYLYANFPPREFLYKDFFTMMDGYDIGVCKLSEEIENVDELTEEEVANTILIEDVVIIGSAPKLRSVYYGTIYRYTYRPTSLSEYMLFFGYGSGGGGGSSSNNDSEAGGDTSAGGIDGKTPEEVSEDIFNNYGNLADSVKTKLNTMIAEIAENCMGKQVLSRLISDNIGVGFSLSSTGNSKYKPESNIIQMVNFHSEELLHELFHALQLEIKAHNSVSAMAEKEVNYEIEAYVATYAYMRRSRVEDVLDRKDILDGSTFWNYIKDIEYALDNTTSLLDNSVISLFVNTLIEDAAWYYIDHKPLDAKYYDRTISSGNNLSLILQITDC